MYKQICENLREIQAGIKLVQLDLRQYIAAGKTKNEYIHTKLLSYLITCWVEVRILKLAYEPPAFTQDETIEIISSSTLENMWITALNIAICKASKISKIQDVDTIAHNIAFTARTRYKELIKLIKDDLLESIQVRNRIVHGQWLYAFTDDLMKVSSDITGRLRRENIVILQLRYALFKSLAQIIHDLAVSRPTYERDFDSNYRKIEVQRKNLHHRDVCIYRRKQIEKYQRGLKKRRENI